jgi:hypothetical protein
MQSDNKATPAKVSPVGCSPIVFVLVIAFVFFTISASIPPLNNSIARYALCPTASEAYFKESSGGTVEKLGVQNDVSGKIVTLYCEYGDAPAKEIDNDNVVVTGFGVSAGLGAVVGLIVYGVMLVRSRRK